MLGSKFRKKRPAAEPRNLLDMVPILTDRIASVEKNEERVTLLLPRRSWLERQSVQWLKQPATIQIHLDVLGSAVVCRCRGNHTVEEIADEIHRRFGEAAEPLLPRLAKFMEVLEANGLLTWLPEIERKNDGLASQ
ncbi:PqqD family protein [Paenibacillus sp. KQZ6P-2]|uniref:PqqD family protein n=1 Tax=Paenibacillus mangrovi TaxID=2931978 RepID=A0A9X1WL48_9BACL|nr:PqqD family protein [Paenibacillus mangrovi]MCJ8010701.1 PqqD family protein [Paenibacillus mangrovi]